MLNFSCGTKIKLFTLNNEFKEYIDSKYFNNDKIEEIYNTTFILRHIDKYERDCWNVYLNSDLLLLYENEIILVYDLF